MRIFGRGAISLCLLWVLSASGAAPAPNIILILADDLGYGDLGCQNPNSQIATPNLDRLAAEGMRFTDAHAPSALCTPSRYSILTGEYCWRTRLKSGVLHTWDEPLIPQDRLTLPGMLRRAGYHTGCFGKWHLGLSWPFTDSVPGPGRAATTADVDWNQRISGGPVDRGFDYFFGLNLANEPPYVFLQNDHVSGVPTVQYPPAAGEQCHEAGPGIAGWAWEQMLPAITSNAVEWLKRQASGPNPFFLYLALPGPHRPVAPTPQFQGTSNAGGYGDYVQELDWYVGQVLAALDATQQAGNTLVFFASDNGPDEFAYPRILQYNHASMGELRGIKGDVWEGGHRIPFLARWPGAIAPATVSAQAICLVDFMRTAAEIVGSALPPNAAEDSVSFLPVLLGQPSRPIARREMTLDSGTGLRALRVDDWVFIDAPTGDGHTPQLEPLWFKQRRRLPLAETTPGLLYNLASDTGERHDAYNQHPRLVSYLRAELRRAGQCVTWNGLQSAWWTNQLNWTPPESPVDADVVYNPGQSGASSTQSIGASITLNSLVVRGDSGTTLSVQPGGPFELGIYNGISMPRAGADLVISADVSLSQSQMWEVGASRTLTVKRAVLNPGCQLMIAGQGNTTLAGQITGDGSLVSRASGVVLMSGDNTYTGGTEVSGGGTLQIANSTGLGSGAVRIPNNSTLQLQAGVTLTNEAVICGHGTAAAAGSGAICLPQSGHAYYDGPIMLTGDTDLSAKGPGSVLGFGGALNGTGSITILPGAGVVVFAGASAYRGDTFLKGQLKLSHGPNRLPPGTALHLANGPAASLDLGDFDQELSLLDGGGPTGGYVFLGRGTLTMNQAADSVFAGSIEGTGGLIKTNLGRLNLAGTNFYKGATLVNGGSLIIDGALQRTAVIVAGGLLGGHGTIGGPVRVEANGTLELDRLSLRNDLGFAPGSTAVAYLDAANNNTSDQVRVAGNVDFNGRLLLHWTSRAGLPNGQRFRIFSSSSSTGNFSTISPAPSPAQGWAFDPTHGTLQVVPLLGVLTLSSARPEVHRLQAQARSLELSWPPGKWRLQALTNGPGSGSSNWFDFPGGSLSPITVPIDPANRSVLLRLAPAD